MEENNNTNHEQQDNGSVRHVSGMYESWFLDYASYVILERAVPAMEDGLKPVQRRILHSMWELEDGRYNKVANIIGNTMKYHPHGDASIGDAMVQMGQKDLLIDTQGNWGNILTGDGAAAPRYIEARLSKLALEILFNPKTTQWGLSYDGRNKEPINLPVKFPLLLAQGVEGIAVGLSCKILPHNFNELIDASIDILRGKKTVIYPDFPTGGMIDVTNYNDGARGGKVRVRAKISLIDKKTLVITEIPFGTTTQSLIDSIVLANEKGKIKIKKIEDNTSENAEIIIHLQPGVSPDVTIDALYAFTSCEVPISPNACVIHNDKPIFLGVTDILRFSTQQTLELLRKELQIRMNELEEAWHFSSLEKIFIEKRIYRKIEEEETWEGVLSAINTGLKPYKKMFKRDITDEDIVKLTEIKIKRISKFDSFKADEHIKGLEDEMAEVQHHLDNITDYTVEYYKNLKKKYGKGRERKTEIKPFETIVATQVAAANVKLYVNREEGFAGYGMKKDEYVCDCSDLDDIIVFREDGTMVVSKISDKAFVGKDILYINVFKKNDERTIYNLIYQDGPKGAIYAKRFAVTGVTRDKVYDLTKGTKGSKVLYFTANPNGEAEIVSINLKSLPNVRKLQFDFDFATLAIKSRNAQGNIVTKYPVKKIVQKEQGVSTLGAQKIWFDDTVQRLNTEGRGTFLGSFKADDKILTVNQNGEYRLTGYDISTHFDENMVHIEKFNPKKIITAVYYDGEKKEFIVKRFYPELTDKKVNFISEAPGSYLEVISTDMYPMLELKFAKSKDKDPQPEKINVHEFETVKNLKAKGKRLTATKIKEINLLNPLPASEDYPKDEIEEPEPSLLFPSEEKPLTEKEKEKKSGVDENKKELTPEDIRRIQLNFDFDE
ncbi:MAG: DNA gyrase/topoisomerase IV subunit A [Bacteroidia bacterium]